MPQKRNKTDKLNLVFQRIALGVSLILFGIKSIAYLLTNSNAILTDALEGLVNILGADHTGYIKRITAAVSALSKNKTKLDCRVCQLVKLFKNGSIQMSGCKNVENVNSVLEKVLYRLKMVKGKM